MYEIELTNHPTRDSISNMIWMDRQLKKRFRTFSPRCERFDSTDNKLRSGNPCLPFIETQSSIQYSVLVMANGEKKMEFRRLYLSLRKKDNRATRTSIKKSGRRAVFDWFIVQTPGDGHLLARMFSTGPRGRMNCKPLSCAESIYWTSIPSQKVNCRLARNKRVSFRTKRQF